MDLIKVDSGMSWALWCVTILDELPWDAHTNTELGTGHDQAELLSVTYVQSQLNTVMRPEESEPIPIR